MLLPPEASHQYSNTPSFHHSAGGLGAGGALTDYDKAYRATPDYFGTDPVGILRDYCHLLGTDRPVLDIGVGQGRNALFLARRGYRVDGIDPSRTAVQTVDEVARDETLPVRLFQCGFEDFESDVDWYSGVLALGLIQTLPRSSIAQLTGRLREWTRGGSVIFITAFTTEDPWLRHVPRGWRPVDRNCYSDDAGHFRTYLDRGELLDLFPGCDVIYHWEGLGPLHRHGEGAAHHHGSVRVVLRRIAGQT
jgi:SAM-dependent methyltransferase